jgi:hypothetical protein
LKKLSVNVFETLGDSGTVVSCTRYHIIAEKALEFCAPVFVGMFEFTPPAAAC